MKKKLMSSKFKVGIETKRLQLLLLTFSDFNRPFLFNVVSLLISKSMSFQYFSSIIYRIENAMKIS
jgi:hypothetical protein